MLNYKEKRTLLILTIISLVLSVIACIPFTLGELTQFELIVKYIVFPIAIAIMTTGLIACVVVAVIVKKKRQNAPKVTKDQ